MSLPKSRRKAVVLISTLVLVVIIFMVFVAAVALIPGQQAASRNLYENRAAAQAAEAGMQYAQARLQERPTWRGDGDGTTPTFSFVSPDGNLAVEENNGNVLGYVRTAGRQLDMQFRIRFNYYDGAVGSAGDADQLNDPPLFLDTPYVSVNNLAGSASIPVPRAVDSGGVFRVTPASPMPYDAPRFTACILVEGRAGQGLRDQWAGGLNPNPNPGNRLVVRTVQEAYFRRGNIAGLDAVAYSGLDIGANTLGQVRVSSASGSDIPRVRSNGNVAVSSLPGGSASYTTDTGGEVYVNNTGSFMVNGAASTAPAGIQQTTPTGKFLQLKWSKIKKAQATDANVAAGTYLWRQGGGGAYLEYYPQNYDPLATYAPGSGTVITSGSGMELTTLGGIAVDPTKYEVKFSKNVWVRPTGSVTGFAIVPEAAMTTAGVRPATVFSPAGASSPLPILTSTGDVTLKGQLSGQGSVSSEGAVTFQGPSVLEADPSNMVAIYAKGDVTLEAIPDQVVTVIGGGTTTGTSSGCSGTCTTSGGSSGCTGTCTTGGSGATGGTGSTSGTSTGTTTGFTLGPPQPQDQRLSGVVYTQRNFKVDLSGVTYQGNLYLRGVLAAYGGDPDAGEAPAANGQGRVDLKADKVELLYDPGYLDGLLDLSGPTPLERSYSTGY